MISSSITNTLFSVSLFFSLLFLRKRLRRKPRKSLSPLCFARKKDTQQIRHNKRGKKSEKGIIMFSSLSMRSALVGTSVPTTSTNSRGTRVHRSRRAQSARIPGTFFASFFCSFPLSSVVAFSRRRRFGSTVSKETARYITQRAHEA